MQSVERDANDKYVHVQPSRRACTSSSRVFCVGNVHLLPRVSMPAEAGHLGSGDDAVVLKNGHTIDNNDSEVWLTMKDNRR